MAIRIGIVAQKGGVGKSTVARLVSCSFAAAGYDVLLADMDQGQATSTAWNDRRLVYGVTPEITVQQASTVDRVLAKEDSYDVVVFDGAPRATASTLDITLACVLTVLPTGLALDDLIPTIQLAHELRGKGVSLERLAICLCRVGDSESELQEATAYIQQTPYHLLAGTLPERTGYRRASDLGRAANETTFPSLNAKADELATSIYNRTKELS